MVFIGIMTTQINLRLSDNMIESAKFYAEKHGFSNVQDFIKETIRQKIYDDPDITGQELELITKLVNVSEKKNLYGTEEQLFKKLR